MIDSTWSQLGEAEKLLRERQRRRHLRRQNRPFEFPPVTPGRACRCAEGSCTCAAAISACLRMIARLFMLLHDALCNNSGCDGVAFRWRQRTAAAAALAIALHHERLQRAPLRPTNCHLSNQNHCQFRFGYQVFCYSRCYCKAPRLSFRDLSPAQSPLFRVFSLSRSSNPCTLLNSVIN